MTKYILALIVILGGINFQTMAQASASELNREIQGMSPADYYRLSQETDRC